jgi:hypothetical protein
MNSGIEQNKATAAAFYDLAFNQKRPDEAVSPMSVTRTFNTIRGQIDALPGLSGDVFLVGEWEGAGLLPALLGESQTG